MTIETRKVCVLSTAHLKPETLIYLNETPYTDWPFSGGPIAYGYYIYANEEPQPPISEDVAAAMLFARAAGFDYIQFDRDGHPVEGLPDYHGVTDVPPTPAFEPFAVREGQFLRVLETMRGENNNCDETEIPAGEIWRCTSATVGRPDSWAFTLTHGSGVSATFDSDDAAPPPVEPVQGQVFACNLRAISQLTATRFIAGATADAAAVEALKVAIRLGFVWDISEPADVQLEGFE